ncbi:MAG TPA: ribulose-phosphate 3-epimerase [Planctomycetes bacterium]|nr:ribulose-phosphate 3-epimerase [Planctomycetota bacterium]
MVAPSLLSADFARLGEEARAMEAAGADWLHLDVMDFHFVPNLTVGPMVAASLRKETDLPIDAHLMVTDPVALARPFAEAGVDWITFHVEAVADPARAAREIRGMGVKVGVSLKPGTPLEALEPCLGEVGLVLVMGVEPGFGGQAWIPETLEKARGLKERGWGGLVSMDGGVGGANALTLAQGGVDVLVAGSAVFCAPDPAGMVRRLRELGEKGAARRPPGWPRPV